ARTSRVERHGMARTARVATPEILIRRTRRRPSIRRPAGRVLPAGGPGQFRAVEGITMAYRSPEQLVSLLQGVFAFPVTPFHADGALNVQALRRHTRNLIGSGVTALFACAGTGEFFSLALDEYREAVAAVVEEVD